MKPVETVRTFIVHEKWRLSNDDVKTLICKHIGIPYDNTVEIELAEWGDIEIKRITSNRQEK